MDSNSERNIKKDIDTSEWTSTFRILYKLNLMRDVQKHYRISFWQLLFFIPKTLIRRLLFNYSVKGYVLEPINKKLLRPKIWRLLGATVGKNVNIGHNVMADFGNMERIKIGNNVVISNGVSLLCHRRDVKNYHKGDNATLLPFIYQDVVIEDGAQIGLNCTILPNVKIGKGTIIGSNSLVTKSLPDFCIGGGCPAKIIRQLED